MEFFIYAVDPQTADEFNYLNNTDAKFVINWQCKDYSIAANQTTIKIVDRPERGTNKTI